MRHLQLIFSFKNTCLAQGNCIVKMYLFRTAVLLCVCLKSSYCTTNEPYQLNMGYQPFEGNPNSFPVVAQFPVHRNVVPQQINQPGAALLHITNGHNQRSNFMPEDTPRNDDQMSFGDFLDTWDDQFVDDHGQFRTASNRGEQTYPYGHPPAYGYPTGQNYGPSKQPAYTAPSNPSSPKIPLLKPDFTELMKPATSKVMNKVSGLLGFVLALLSGTLPQGFHLQGMKDLLINGVLQPLLAAKIGIKSLIAKLIVPIVALILINVEVLVSVWWLWEECPQSPSGTSVAQPDKPPQYNSNSYR